MVLSAADPHSRPPSALPFPTRRCHTIVPLLSGSSAQTTPDFWPITMRLLPLGKSRRMAELPKSKSGPSSSGQFSRDGVQPTTYTSLGVTWLVHRILPLLRSSAITASLVGPPGPEYSLPVATYSAPRFRSIVGADQMATPDGS